MVGPDLLLFLHDLAELLVDLYQLGEEGADGNLLGLDCLQEGTSSIPGCRELTRHGFHLHHEGLALLRLALEDRPESVWSELSVTCNRCGWTHLQLPLCHCCSLPLLLQLLRVWEAM